MRATIPQCLLQLFSSFLPPQGATWGIKVSWVAKLGGVQCLWPARQRRKQCHAVLPQAGLEALPTLCPNLKSCLPLSHLVLLVRTSSQVCSVCFYYSWASSETPEVPVCVGGRGEFPKHNCVIYPIWHPRVSSSLSLWAHQPRFFLLRCQWV